MAGEHILPRPAVPVQHQRTSNGAVLRLALERFGEAAEARGGRRTSRGHSVTAGGDVKESAAGAGAKCRCSGGWEVARPSPSPDPDKEMSTIRLFR
jgi:hypothetical protein